MWVAVHALTGLALGVWSPWGLGPTLAAALLLHLLLDLVPHWDYSAHRRRTIWAILDVATAVTVVAALAATAPLGLVAVAAAVVSALPDLDVLDVLLPGGRRRRWFPSHWSRFPHGHAAPLWGISIQLVIALGSLFAIILKA